ncbi:FtsX-like permease family protein [Sulfurimonas sp. HSL-3221]|uniref:ABC transporter permease n=1 Tax=Sulfurimonadaceae TaxID=2771471 RepID=UPI001E382B87|nr:FtsX-like permease family protein [Sulfurimonas sp. HSL-3221]UFS62390.1 FtsX-like permease family protein [Sulfurimonas sp. HSL-3221]
MFGLALKNILHYKGRTVVTFALTFFSSLLFIVYVALMDGSHAHMLKSALDIYENALHIYKKGYREEGGYDYLLTDVSAEEALLARTAGIAAYAPRLESFALLSTPRDSVGAMVVGINPGGERRLSKMAEARREGRYLEDNDTNALYIGSELAVRLKVGVGDTVALIGTATDDSFAAENFRIVGIFKTGLFEFDASSAFVNKAYYDTLMLSGDMASYIVASVDDLTALPQTVNAVQAGLAEGLEAVPWTVLMHAQVEAMEVDSVFGYISMGVFFVVIFFVIMIFSFLNIVGRTRELGMLRAIGLSPRNVSALLLLEMLLIALAAVGLSVAVGAPIAWYFELHPMVIEGIAEAYRDYGIVDDQIPMRFDWSTIGWNAGVVFALNMLAVLYPIAVVKRYTPVEAMHHV